MENVVPTLWVYIFVGVDSVCVGEEVHLGRNYHSLFLCSCSSTLPKRVVIAGL